MSIKERKFREAGNSAVLTISRDFLKEKGLHPGDTIFLDAEKLRAAIQKNSVEEIDVAIFQSSTQYDPGLKELVDKWLFIIKEKFLSALFIKGVMIICLLIEFFSEYGIIFLTKR